MLMTMRSFILSAPILPRIIDIAEVWLIALVPKKLHSCSVSRNEPTLHRNIPFCEETDNRGKRGKIIQVREFK